MGLPSWVQPETKPAPMPLLRVQTFVNTWDVEAGEDTLLKPGAAAEWLGAAGLAPATASLSPADLRLAREVREGFRALLTANGGGPPPAEEALKPLYALTGAYHLAASIGAGGTVELIPSGPAAGSGPRGAGPSDPAGGPDGPGAEPSGLGAGLFGLVLVMRDAQVDGTWPRLKACRNPDCRWVFYDRSHSRRGAWCDMTVCGNRLKNRALRERRKS